MDFSKMVRLITVSVTAEPLLEAQLMKRIFLKSLNKGILSFTPMCIHEHTRAPAHAHL